MPRRSLTAALLTFLLAVAPSAALAQGAGDDQYQDPFGGQQTTPSQGGQGGDDGGLSPEPPGGGNGGGSGGSGDSGGGDAGGSGQEETPEPAPDGTSPEADDQLPNTGSEPLVLAVLGTSLLLAGVGLRLRTIDPNHF